MGDKQTKERERVTREEKGKRGSLKDVRAPDTHPDPQIMGLSVGRWKEKRTRGGEGCGKWTSWHLGEGGWGTEKRQVCKKN